MRVYVAAFFLVLTSTTVAAQGAAAKGGDANMARALKVLRASPVMDGHNDLPWRIREDTVHPHDVEAYDLRKRAPGMTGDARSTFKARAMLASPPFAAAPWAATVVEVRTRKNAATLNAHGELALARRWRSKGLDSAR